MLRQRQKKSLKTPASLLRYKSCQWHHEEKGVLMHPHNPIDPSLFSFHFSTPAQTKSPTDSHVNSAGRELSTISCCRNSTALRRNRIRRVFRNHPTTTHLLCAHNAPFTFPSFVLTKLFLIKQEYEHHSRHRHEHRIEHIRDYCVCGDSRSGCRIQKLGSVRYKALNHRCKDVKE